MEITILTDNPNSWIIPHVNELKQLLSNHKVKHIFSNGSLNIMQPKYNYHKGWNRNQKERVNLVIDFYNGRHANEMDLKKYYEEYNKVFYGLDNMHDFYEAKKIF